MDPTLLCGAADLVSITYSEPFELAAYLVSPERSAGKERLDGGSEAS